MPLTAAHEIILGLDGGHFYDAQLNELGCTILEVNYYQTRVIYSCE